MKELHREQVQISPVPFSLFLIIAQTLRAYSSFQQKIAKMGPFLIERIHFEVPLQPIRIHAVLCCLYEKLS